MSTSEAGSLQSVNPLFPCGHTQDINVQVSFEVVSTCQHLHFTLNSPSRHNSDLGKTIAVQVKRPKMSQLWSSPKSPATAGPVRRFGQIIKLKPEHVAKYKEIHAAVWPGVLEQIKASNIRDCNLFLDVFYTRATEI